MRFGAILALSYAGAATAVHAVIVLVSSYCWLEWQNPLEWSPADRFGALLVSLWLGLLAPFCLAMRRWGQ